MEKTIKETTRLLLNGTLTKEDADKILLDLYNVSSTPFVHIKHEGNFCIEMENDNGLLFVQLKRKRWWWRDKVINFVFIDFERETFSQAIERLFYECRILL